MAAEEQSYLVRRSGEPSGRLVSAASIEEAAVAFLEVADAEDGELRIVVRPCDGHEEHCLVIDVDTGQTRQC
ncbi:MAG: DUF5961 family protein [Caulobacter sp.]